MERFHLYFLWCVPNRLQSVRIGGLEVAHWCSSYPAFELPNFSVLYAWTNSDQQGDKLNSYNADSNFTHLQNDEFATKLYDIDWNEFRVEDQKTILLLLQKASAETHLSFVFGVLNFVSFVTVRKTATWNSWNRYQMSEISPFRFFKKFILSSWCSSTFRLKGPT